jgi:L-methionine (R)-S-oxide reductase
MIESEISTETSKREMYQSLTAQLASLFEDEHDLIANMANCSSLIYHTLPELNWAGFYIFKDGELVLGPFQGRLACTRIAIGRGVCGTAAAQRSTVVVDNVHEFPGHIACDIASNSEIVVPLVKEDRLIGVLDLDSPIYNRFDAEDVEGLERLAEVFLSSTDVE